MSATDGDDYYARLLSFHETSFVTPSLVRSDALIWPKIPERLAALAERMPFIDQRLGLPEGIHAKLDRASMATALELRVPLLDPRLIELSWQIPRDWQVGREGSKLLLRELLRRRVPAELVDRPKQGFDVPIAAWLRGPLGTWAGDLLATVRTRPDSHVDAVAAQRMLAAHVSGRVDFGYALWALLMYCAWLVRHG